MPGCHFGITWVDYREPDARLRFLRGTFSSNITTTSRTVTVVDPNTFDIDGITCTTAPTVTASTIMVSNPCRITMVQDHGLTTGNSVTVSGVSGGTFSPTISNATFAVTLVDSTSFTIPVNCTAAATANTGSIVGGHTLRCRSHWHVQCELQSDRGEQPPYGHRRRPGDECHGPGNHGGHREHHARKPVHRHHQHRPQSGRQWRRQHCRHRRW